MAVKPVRNLKVSVEFYSFSMPTFLRFWADHARPYWLAWSMAAIFQSPLEVRA
jgi:hypothetical protein